MDAVETLFGRYQDPIYGFLVSMLRESHDAEDVLQETFFKALRGLKNYREQQQFKAWIYRIARNEALTLIRKRSRMTPQEDPYQAAQMTEVDPSVQPREQVEKAEALESLEAALAELPAVEREVVLLRIKADIPFKEIAALMDCSVNTVLGRMHNAKKRLRRFLLTDQTA